MTARSLVPGHFMTPSVVEKRKPLSSDARRSGWVRSNILLDRIPDAGHIELIAEGEPRPRERLRDEFGRTAFLADTEASARDWTTVVRDCIEELPVERGEEFELADVYDLEDRLADQYPDDDHIRAKIRQQLQVLRDEGLIEFPGDGEYRLRWVDDRE